MQPSRGNPSAELAALYHAQHTRQREDLPFWTGLAVQYGSPILELGCGTGRILIHLARRVRPAYGLDIDPEMLRFLKRRQPGQVRKRVHVFQANMAAFRLAARFSLIFMPCNTLSTLSTPDREGTFARVIEHLQPGGLFAASVPNPVLLETLPSESDPEVDDIFDHPVTGNPVQASSAWKRTAGRFELSWHYDHLFPDGTVERLTAQTTHAIIPPAEYTAALEAAGFTSITRYGDYDQSAYTPDSPLLILLAQISHS